MPRKNEQAGDALIHPARTVVNSSNEANPYQEYELAHGKIRESRE
jgi:hypothetical protein